MIPQLRWLVALLLGLLVLWAPLPFGSAPAWAVSILQWGAAAALLLCAWVARDARRLRAVRAPFGLFLALAAFGVLQSLAVPRWLASLLSPGHARLSSAVGEVVEAGWVHLSLSPDLSRRTALWWLALAAAFVSAAMVGERSARRRVLLGSVLLAALFQAAFGLRELFLERSTIWGVRVPQPPGRLRGSFINPDHAAFLFLLALSICFAWIVWAARSHRWPSSWTNRVARAIVPAALWIGFLAAILLTGSRAALAAALGGTLVQAVLIGRGRKRLWIAGVVLLLVVAGLGLVAGFAFDAGFGRLAGTTAFELIWNDRWVAYRATLAVWSRFPILGTGLGSFRDAFPLAQPEGLHEVWRHAHSDWLELLATMGLVGLGLVIAAIWLLGRRLWRQEERAARSEDHAGAVAGLGALAMAAFHSMLDFSLTMPADAFTLAVLLGCASGAPAIGSARRRRLAVEEGHRAGLRGRAGDVDQLDEVGTGPDLRPDRDPGAGLVRHRLEEPAVQADLDRAAE
jgi:O-antigen ligase